MVQWISYILKTVQSWKVESNALYSRAFRQLFLPMGKRKSFIRVME